MENEDSTWEYEGTTFWKCPKCEKGIPKKWNKHSSCGWAIEGKKEITSVVDISSDSVNGYDGAFLGMCYNQAWMNAREYEKTYEDAKNNLNKYYTDTFKAAKLLLKGKS